MMPEELPRESLYQWTYDAEANAIRYTDPTNRKRIVLMNVDTTIRAIEDEYWSIQYLTRISGYPEPVFWPPSGQGEYRSEEDALTALRAEMFNHYKQMRVLHIVRKIAYGRPVDL